MRAADAAPSPVFTTNVQLVCINPRNGSNEALPDLSFAGDLEMAVRNGGRYVVSEIQNSLAVRTHGSADNTILATLSGRDLQPNRGIALNLDWVAEVRANLTAVDRPTPHP